MLGDWVTYLSDGTISLVNLAISAGATIVGGLTVDSIDATTDIVAGLVTSTSHLVAAGNLNISGTSALGGAVTASSTISATDYKLSSPVSRGIPIRQFATAVNANVSDVIAANAASWGYSTAHLDSILRFGDRVQSVSAVFTSRSAGTTTLSLFSFDPSTNSNHLVLAVNSTATGAGTIQLVLSTPPTISAAESLYVQLSGPGATDVCTALYCAIDHP